MRRLRPSRILPSRFHLGTAAALLLALATCDPGGGAEMEAGGVEAREAEAGGTGAGGTGAGGTGAGGTQGGFFAGRRLEVLVPFGPGGGSDTWMRMIAPHLQPHLGAGASIQVFNVAGAMSIAGGNDFALRRRRDGRTAFVSGGSTFFPYLLGEPMVRYDFHAMTPILASPVGGVVFISPETGVRRAADLARVREPLIYGGIAATGNDLLPLLAFDLLGLNVKPILGYASKGATRVAFEQRETDIEYQTMPAYLRNVRPLEEAGVAVPLFSFGILDDSGDVVRDPAVPHLPTLVEVYRELRGAEPDGIRMEAYRAVLTGGTMLQKVLWMHGDAPEEAVRELRAAVEVMVRDSTFLARARAEVGDYPFYTGDAVDAMLRSALDVSPETMTWIRRYLRDTFGVDRIGR